MLNLILPIANAKFHMDVADFSFLNPARLSANC